MINSMNSNKPSEKCIAYLKIKGCVFDEIDTFGNHCFIKRNSGLLWYIPKYNQWYAYRKYLAKLEDKLNELQHAK